jgi:hypothetical protein
MNHPETMPVHPPQTKKAPVRRRVRYLLAGLVLVPSVVGLLVAAGRLGQQTDTAEDPPPVISEDGPLPDNAGLERLAREDPVAFLETCLRRYQRDVKGYSATFQKQEREDGKLQPTEIVEARYREKPRSVYMQWLEGAGRADRVLYVEGENGGKLLAHPKGAFARKIAGEVVERGEDSADFRKLGRFGLKKATERVLTSMKKERDKGPLHVQYLGEVRVKEVNDRPCYKLRWTVEMPQNDKDVREVTMYIDKETWLQVGTVLKGEDNKLLGEFFFRDLRLNPDFKPEQFERSALIPKD